ncbi:serine/arginine-rich splicing factor SR45a [Populus alba x Populus x berolinensis]|nr:serine/arginine-rich splicing factor SR45a [Populus alba x Populus x berolinensis]
MQAKRKRGRTPTPGRYQGLRDKRAFSLVMVMVMATDGPAATHLADGMTEIESLIQGIEGEDHALLIVGGEMVIMIHIRGAGIALCQLTAATTDRASYLVASINPFCPWLLKLDFDSHGSINSLCQPPIPVPSFLVCLQLHVLFTFNGNLFSISDA